MRATTIFILTLLFSTVALAQPGAVEPGEEGGAPPPAAPVYAGPPPQQPYYTQPVQLELTEEQQDLLARGEIPKGKWIAGGIVAYVVGFGIGHAVQDRYSDRGWIFTVGEVGSLASIVYGFSVLTRDVESGRWERGGGYIVGGIIGMAAFRVWEVVDAWVAPPLHNKKVRGLRHALGLGPQLSLEGLYLAPPQVQGSGGVAGLSMSF